MICPGDSGSRSTSSDTGEGELRTGSIEVRVHFESYFTRNGNISCGNQTQLYKWKNHFYEMKGDVGMSLHEKERNKKMPTPRHKVTHNPIPTSLFCFNMLFVCLFVCSL